MPPTLRGRAADNWRALIAIADLAAGDWPLNVRRAAESLSAGRSERFKAEFEHACQARAITLYELPPRRPQLNGGVERCNGAWRYEFYAVYELPPSVEALTPILDSYQHLYNHHRPHGALAGLTPAQYL